MIELLNGVLSVMRSGAKAFTAPVLSAANSAVSIHGGPFPTAPTCFIAISDGGLRSFGEACQDDMRLVHSVIVHLSVRTIVARDRYDEMLSKSAPESLVMLERQALRAIHGSQALRAAANDLLDVGQADYLTPLFFDGRSAPEIRDGSWSNEDGADPVGWLVKSLRFTGAHRVFYLNSI